MRPAEVISLRKKRDGEFCGEYISIISTGVWGVYKKTT